MPLPQKRRGRRHSGTKGGGGCLRLRYDADDGVPSSPRRAEYISSSSSSSSDESCSSRRPLRDGDSSGGSSSSSDSDGSPKLRRYQPSLLDDLLDQLDLPPSADGVEPDPVDRPDLLPYGEILQALTSSSFLDGELLRSAVAEYQVHKYCEETMRGYRDPDSEEVVVVERRPRGDSGVAEEEKVDDDTYSVNDDISSAVFINDSKQLKSRRTPVDEYDKLDPEDIEELEMKRAFYRIKAILLLKGKAVDKMDDAALETKYPRELIVKNSYFLRYKDHSAFGWYFDSKLCQLAALTDYQRLVIVNYCQDQYQDWSSYRSLYNTPETDRDYLLYWKTITQKIKWIEDYMHLETFSREWSNISRKAYYQAIRIATGFENIHKDLALLGIEEFLWSTRLYVYNLKDLDGVFYEIWRRVIKEENVKDCFAKALKEVSDLKMFPSRERSMKYEETMAEQFDLCTAGITKEVPESIARGLIAQQVRRKLAMTRGYEHYARKKLKVAEYIGLIGKAST